MIAIVYGCRPEAIKLGPVAAELRVLGVPLRVICTGQHTDLLVGTPAETDLADGLSLALTSEGDVIQWLRRAESALGTLWNDERPQAVIVQGDTMSAQAGANVAHARGIPVLHVEAGVRSGDVNDPWPEEQIRVGITRQARWHYAPTARAVANLVGEGIANDRILMTGNPVVSALRRYAPQAQPTDLPEMRVLVTLHRREIQTAAATAELYTAISQIAAQKPQWRFWWPIHPAFARVLPPQRPMPPNVTLANHTAYPQFAEQLANARVVITDSGGVVEEAATLGVPTLIARRTNDRPEAVDAGIAVVAAPLAPSLTIGFRRVCTLPRRPVDVFGDAQAATRIAEHIASVYTREVNP